MFGKSVRYCVYKICGFVSGKKLATVGYVVEVFLSRKFNGISENFKLVSPSVCLQIIMFHLFFQLPFCKY